MTSFLHWNQGLIHTTFRIASLGKNIQVNRNIDGIHIPSITSSGCEDTVARATNGLDRSLKVIHNPPNSRSRELVFPLRSLCVIEGM